MRLADLTPRQRQVTALIAAGLNRQQIADRLEKADGNHVSIRTVDIHIQSIADKLPPDDRPRLRRIRRWLLSQSDEKAPEPR